MFRRKSAIPDHEKRELRNVQKRLEKLEPRAVLLETQLKLIRRQV